MVTRYVTVGDDFVMPQSVQVALDMRTQSLIAERINAITSLPVVSRTASATLDSSDFGKMQVVTATTATVNLSLPNPTTCVGQQISLRISPASTKLVTLTTVGAGNTIEGLATRVMWAGETALLQSVGTSWVKLSGRAIPMQAEMYLAAAQNIAHGTVAVVKLDTSRRNNTGLMVNTAQNRIDILRPATYFVQAHSTLASVNTTMYRFISYAYKNVDVPDGTTNSVVQEEVSGYSAAGGSTPNLKSVGDVSLIAGDYLKLATFQLCTTAQTASLRSGAEAAGCQLSAREIPDW